MEFSLLGQRRRSWEKLEESDPDRGPAAVQCRPRSRLIVTYQGARAGSASEGESISRTIRAEFGDQQGVFQQPLAAWWSLKMLPYINAFEGSIVLAGNC